MTITYKFLLPKGIVKKFQVELDKTTLNLRQQPPKNPPAWTQLTYQQCPNCPLNPAESPQCPAALSLVDIVNVFQELQSFEETTVEVAVAERQTLKKTSVQKALSSLLGIYMVTSGCPILEKLKPMARFHLPFATPDETMYRALSMYLLAQYFIEKNGGQPDWTLQKLNELYHEIRTVNKSFAKRLQDASQLDANVNALVILDCFAQTANFVLDKNKLEELEQVFEVYLR